MVDNEKMSKMKGNFLTLSYCMSEWGSDATRFALADAGDSIEDANFNKETANSAILRLTKETDFISEVLDTVDSFRTESTLNFYDEVFLNNINRVIALTDAAYAGMQFREALKSGFFELCIHRDEYRLGTSLVNFHRATILRYCEVALLLLSPICPHITEFLWQKLNKGCLIVNASWPVSKPVDYLLYRQSTYLENVGRDVRIKLKDTEASRLKRETRAKEKNTPFNVFNFNFCVFICKEKQVTTCIISVAASFPAWQQEVLQVCANEFDLETKTYRRELPKVFQENEILKKKMKVAMQFSAHIKVCFINL